MTEAGATAAFVLGPPLIGLAQLVARLGWQARRDRRRQDTLGVLASRLPDGGVLDLRSAVVGARAFAGRDAFGDVGEGVAQQSDIRRQTGQNLAK